VPATTIGVFDSGFGGLTVLRELLPLIPGAHYIYLGDTARLPYGSKSRITIARYAVESARFLANRGAGHLVIACNTASALALDDIRSAVPISVTGVIEPGARSAWATLAYRGADEKTYRPQDFVDPNCREVLVLATQATVSSHAYNHACHALGLRAVEKACPLLVPLVEEGWIDHPVTREVIRIYLQEALDTCSPEVVILGCTHYPLIAPLVSQTLKELGSSAEVVDSARATAFVVSQALSSPQPSTSTPAATFECYATDSTEKFAHLGTQFLGQPIPKVELLDLGG
jgi:glutamate racemase